MSDLAKLSQRLEAAIGLRTCPVAVSFVGHDAPDSPFGTWKPADRHRYCQALMRARNGEQVRLGPEEIACPAAASAFGFRRLPKGLESGKGLVGYGIVEEPETGQAMFSGMTRLAPGEIEHLALSPLGLAPETPDVVVVEGEVEQLMWLVLADVNLSGGARRRGMTAVLQATCVDSTIIPYREQRLNFSMGCYGCREATDMAPSETVVGFPGKMLEPLVGAVEHLADKAIPRSRQKKPYHRLVEDDVETEQQAVEPKAEARKLRPGALPQLQEDIVMHLASEDVVSIFRVVMDDDRDEAFRLVQDRLYRQVKRILERPRCSVAFEMERKLAGGQ